MAIVGIVLIGLGCVLIIIGLAFRVPYKNVRQFADNKVEGQIVDMVWNAAEFNQPREDAANVEQFKIAGVEMRAGSRSRTNGDRPTANMYHKVYRYMVDGREYFRADGVRYDKGTVQSWIGKTVPVYYNPENPQQSTLSNGGGYKLTMIILYVVGGLAVLNGVGVLLLSLLVKAVLW